MMMKRNADGTVDHDGEYNPWLELDQEDADRCKAAGGFVMQTGVVHFGPTKVEFVNGNMRVSTGPKRYTGDGLMYVSLYSPKKITLPWGMEVGVNVAKP